jgi:hypothetical protein
MDKYRFICKTDIKKKYFIKPDEMLEYESFVVTNTTYGKQDMTLYKLTDVKDVFCMGYNINRNDNKAIDNKLNKLQKDYQDKLQIKKNIRDEKKEIIMNERKKNLKNALVVYGLELRSDSWLCNGYIDGTIKDWSIRKIVKRMCQMKFLFENCNMDKYFKEAKEERQILYDSGIRPYCSLFEDAEILALENCGGYPKKWDWLK